MRIVAPKGRRSHPQSAGRLLQRGIVDLTILGGEL